MIAEYQSEEGGVPCFHPLDTFSQLMPDGWYLKVRNQHDVRILVIIPVDDAGLFVGEKGVYLNMTAIEMRDPKYSETHCVKVSFDKDRYDAMSEEERNSQPIIGGMKQLERKATEMSVGSLDGSQVFTDYNDLPF